MEEIISYLSEVASLSQLRQSILTTTGQIELMLSLVIFIGGYFLSLYLFKSKKFLFNRVKKSHSFRQHLKFRLALPFFLSVALLLAAIIWFLLGYEVIWLSFLLRAAIWLGLIRLVMIIIRYTIPNNLFDIHSEALLSKILWGYFLLWASGLDHVILGWMDSITFPIGKNKISLLSVLSAIFWVGIVIVVAMWFARLLESRIMHLKQIDLNVRIVISKLLTTGMVFLAVLIALPIVGIDLTVLSVFGGALGVGLGFGLQKIASSYVSGFIILLERSLHLGDMVIIGNSKGIVSKITSRYVVLKAPDGSEHLIPNDSIISNTVTNLSLSSRSIRGQVEVQASYDSDLDFVMELMLKAANHERIMAEPPPMVFLSGFGDDGFMLMLSFWVMDSENGLTGVRSDVFINIWKLFKEHNIEIPYPQREIRVLSPTVSQETDLLNE